MSKPSLAATASAGNIYSYLKEVGMSLKTAKTVAQGKKF